MGKLKNLVKKICYTPNSLRHDLEGELVFKHLQEHGPFGCLVDAGAGGGGYSIEILRRKIAKKVIAVEAEASNFRVLQQRASAFGSAIETHECYLEETPAENGAADAVICNQVLEHIEDHERAAQKLVDMLAPGGILVASVPRSPVALPQAEHVRDGYSEEEFEALFANRGMEVVCFDWFYTLETQDIRRKLRALRRYNIFPPKVLFSVKELAFTPEERREQDPMGLMLVARKKSV